MYNFRNSEPVRETDRRKRSQREKRRKSELLVSREGSLGGLDTPSRSALLPNLHSRQTFPSDNQLSSLSSSRQSPPISQRVRRKPVLDTASPKQRDSTADSKQAEEHGGRGSPLRLGALGGQEKLASARATPHDSSTFRSQKSTSHTQRSMASVYSQLSHLSQLSMTPSIAQIADAATQMKQQQKDGSSLFPVLAAINSQVLFFFSVVVSKR